MVEFEIKYKVEAFPSLSKGFVQRTSERVIDVYYDNHSYDLIHRGIFIRRRGERIDIKFLISKDNHSICNEHNTKLKEFSSNNIELVTILNSLNLVFRGKDFQSFLIENGLEILLTIDKKRTEFVEKDITVCFDEVEGLGKFIEIETLFEDLTDYSDAKKMLDSILSEKIYFRGDYKEELTGYVELYLKNYNPKGYERCLFKG